jgi:hypothetical protein
LSALSRCLRITISVCMRPGDAILLTTHHKLKGRKTIVVAWRPVNRPARGGLHDGSSWAFQRVLDEQELESFRSVAASNAVREPRKQNCLLFFLRLCSCAFVAGSRFDQRDLLRPLPSGSSGGHTDPARNEEVDGGHCLRGGRRSFDRRYCVGRGDCRLLALRHPERRSRSADRSRSHMCWN